MPHGLEYIVRPFQSPGSLGNIVIPGTPERTEDKAHITWGGVGTMPSTKVINPDSKVNVCHETEKEQSRENERVRIMGNDGESYVDVDRVKTMKLEHIERTNNFPIAETWQGFPLNPKIDPKLAAYKDSFKPQREEEVNKQCALGWSFQPSIGTPF